MEMKETLKHLLYECLSAGKKGEVDPSRYPSQVHTHLLFNPIVFEDTISVFFLNMPKCFLVAECFLNGS